MAQQGRWMRVKGPWARKSWDDQVLKIQQEQERMMWKEQAWKNALVLRPLSLVLLSQSNQMLVFHFSPPFALVSPHT
jgi:hypothetical protein